jgi:light-regulated signal transduction histidine kinase (bacteriophytochrome)
MELELADFHLPQAIDNALVLVRERALRRGITLEQSIDPRLGQIQGDERKIKQVLLNLLSNALKFTPEGGRIEVGAVSRDGSAEVSVSDTGVASLRRIRKRCSRSSARWGRRRRKRREQGWDSPCAGSSSNSMAEESGSRARWAWARRSRSRSRCVGENEPSRMLRHPLFLRC